MKIDEYLSIYRNDFTALLVCEHCGNKQKITTGYNDAYYHRHVIPAITCSACGRNRAGEVTAPNPNGHLFVPAVAREEH